MGRGATIINFAMCCEANQSTLAVFVSVHWLLDIAHGRDLLSVISTVGALYFIPPGDPPHPSIRPLIAPQCYIRL